MTNKPIKKIDKFALLAEEFKKEAVKKPMPKASENNIDKFAYSGL
jgi:hypothetical protein